MTRPIWLIEAQVYGDELTPLVAAIRDQNMRADIVDYRTLQRGLVELPPDACVLGYGTYPFAQQILLHHTWTPGAWCSADRLDCAHYYPHFARYLLNQPCEILPVTQAIRERERLYTAFGYDGRVFARPSSCAKLFVGRCVERDDFASTLAPARYDSEAQVVVARPQPIEREWRLVVVGEQVVGGSQYAQAGERAITPDCPSEVRAFAESILADVSWRPDPAFMLDVCESQGRLWLVELNSFSASWLYACDLPVVVAAASELAERLR